MSKKNESRQFKKKHYPQNYKKCLGCGEYYDLDVFISKCENCGCLKFIACTD